MSGFQSSAADRVAVVTGGASGIGQATTKRLVEDGFRVTVLNVAVSAGDVLAIRTDVPELRAQVEATIPMGRVARPEEIAEAIALLAGDRLAYLTGHALVVAGGWTAL
ncbi:hypothetical protein TH66_05835 [Carbonactinospora thermoautotrophica]|uniref:Uncharacterized protein n=1 Tax=Carbonactinospora thermoautotrophica TaxID=1469144 RepID=A0A132N5E0_9ACTN|nr:SDR family oxidoreductase [Carbonactinospora thermoautotrophica]KWX04722.1 hypothetical protein TH66_05835 [Carbonactinospora thermoautotrophica]KWX05200.1 hypothetical protein TR74_23860 [Carbonactinospora thermoautotrophica]